VTSALGDNIYSTRCDGQVTAAQVDQRSSTTPLPSFVILMQVSRSSFSVSSTLVA
jgi:hypothetical protein